MKTLLSILALSTALLAQNKIDLSRQVKGNLSNTALAGIFTTKGDTLGFSTSVIRVPVGNDGFCFVADSTQASGVKWAACPGGTAQVNGTNISTQNPFNFQNGTGTTVSNPSAGNIQVAVVYGSGANTAAAGNDARITGAEQTANKGVASGYAGLDAGAHQLCAQEPALTGDATSPAGSCAMTNVKVNGVAYASSPATNTVPLISAANTATYTALSDCQDSAGNHLNYNATSHTFSCGTSSSGGGGGSPGGSGTEIQSRGGVSTFSAVTGSSTSGGNIALGAGNGFIAGGGLATPGYSVTRTDSTHLSIGAECGASGAYCADRFTTKVCSFNSGTMPATLTISGGQSQDIHIGVRGSDCALIARYNGVLTLAGTNITPVNSATDPSDGSFHLKYIWPTNSVSGQFDAAGTAQQTSGGGDPITVGSGLTGSYNSSTGATTVSVSPASAPLVNVVADSGAVNAYVIAPSPAFSSLATGDVAYFTTANANTAASTINVNGLGVKSITKKGATALVSGDILAGSPAAIYKIVYDGTEWQLFNYSATGSGTVTSVATTSPITGGTFTTSGTIACATCVTSAAALTSGQLMTGAGSQASQVSNLSGDVTTSGSTATTVVKVNGAAVPTSAAIVGTNASQQIIAHTLVAADLPIATSSAVGGVIPRDNHVVDASGNLDFDPSDANVMQDWDDFYSGSGGTGNQIGKMGWSANSITASPTMSAQAGVFPHYGIERLASIATSGDGGTMALSPSSVVPLGDMKTNALWSQKWIFRLNQTVTEAFRIGFADNTGSASPNNGIWLRFDTTASDANFKFEARSSSTSDTVVDSSIAVDTAWHKIVIASPSSGKITFQLDAGSVFCITTAASDGACPAGSTFSATHIPTAGLYNIMILATEAAVISSADVDFWSFKIRGLGR